MRNPSSQSRPRQNYRLCASRWLFCFQVLVLLTVSESEYINTPARELEGVRNFIVPLRGESVKMGLVRCCVVVGHNEDNEAKNRSAPVMLCLVYKGLFKVYICTYKYLQNIINYSYHSSKVENIQSVVSDVFEM